MTLDRREMLRLAGVGCAALATGVRPADAKATPGPVSPNSWAVLVDTVACIGCRKCEWACNVENALSNRPASTFDDKSVLDVDRLLRAVGDTAMAGHALGVIGNDAVGEAVHREAAVLHATLAPDAAAVVDLSGVI